MLVERAVDGFLLLNTAVEELDVRYRWLPFRHTLTRKM